jgi:hypothetical protein
MAGTYYQKWGSGINNYVFLWNFPTMFMHVSHVRSIKFPMIHSNHKVIGSDPVYTLPDYSLHGIMQALVVLDSGHIKAWIVCI